MIQVLILIVVKLMVTSGTKKTLSNTDESTRKCSWDADSTFQFTIKKFGLLPKGGTEADIVYRGHQQYLMQGQLMLEHQWVIFLQEQIFLKEHMRQ